MGLRTRVEVACRVGRDLVRIPGADWTIADIQGTDLRVFAKSLPRGRTLYRLLEPGKSTGKDPRHRDFEADFEATEVNRFAREVVRRFGEVVA